MAMGVLAAIGFGLGACFLLSSYVGQAFSRSRITR
jgi:hypothetical protein